MAWNLSIQDVLAERSNTPLAEGPVSSASQHKPLYAASSNFLCLMGMPYLILAFAIASSGKVHRFGADGEHIKYRNSAALQMLSVSFFHS